MSQIAAAWDDNGEKCIRYSTSSCIGTFVNKKGTAQTNWIHIRNIPRDPFRHIVILFRYLVNNQTVAVEWLAGRVVIMGSFVGPAFLCIMPGWG
jgi:hypothetical protein